MTRKPHKQSGMAPLQEVELIPITDPAEQAALLQRIREAEHNGAVRRFLDFGRELQPEERSSLLAQLVAALPPDEQQALVRRLTAQLRRKSTDREALPAKSPIRAGGPSRHRKAQ